ncbi:hypothetical protein [Agrobacterium rosae]|uniref:hypothetical protein n=1 Tax=Agrobacterium rosae TaxID=1972867 RepID=UPI0013566EB7|nr:hypothetical protein [Agrobacterium rosae]
MPSEDGKGHPAIWNREATQLRWEFAADFEDQKNERCAGFYDGVKTHYGNKH